MTANKLSVFAVLVAIALVPSVASANVITCAATASSPQVRAEGISELVGDITLTCTSSDTTATNTTVSFLVNITATYSTNVTNPTNADDEVTNAVLVVGGGDTDADGDATLTTYSENDCATPADVGAASACTDSTAAVQDPQYGVMVGDTGLTWVGVTLPNPSADAAGDGTADHNAETTFRITGVRTNASLLGVPASAGIAGSDITADVTMLAFPVGDNSVVLSGNTGLTVGSTLLGLASAESGVATDGLQCVDEAASASLNYITITEGFPTALRDDAAAVNAITNQVTSEAGHAEDNMAGVGGASTASQIKLAFTGVPAGVEVGVVHLPDCTEDDPIAADGADDADTLVLTSGTCDADGGTYVAGVVETDGILDTYTAVAITDGSGQICYDVTTNSSALSEDCAITIVSGWTADTENDSPGRAAYTVSASYAPISTVATTDDDTASHPRFISSGGAALPVGEVVSCSSTVLFPFVTNQSGYDTGLVVANTSDDGTGDATVQAGTCSLAYYGTTGAAGAAPVADTTDSIAAGGQLIWLLSSGNSAQGVEAAADFQGYVIATCDFQWGHGYAFITNGFGGVPTLAQGYLGLVIGTRTTVPESLGN